MLLLKGVDLYTFSGLCKMGCYFAERCYNGGWEKSWLKCSYHFTKPGLIFVPVVVKWDKLSALDKGV